MATSQPPRPNPRRQAAKMLQRVLQEGAYTNRLLDHARRLPGWDSRDFGLCSELTYGVTRRLLTLDAVLDAFARKGISSIDPAILQPLRIAAYELLFLDRIPPHASISEAVKAVKKIRGKAASGFANGLLRNIQRNPSLEPLLPAEEPARLSIETSHPLWLTSRTIDQMGLPRARQRLLAHNQPAPLTFRVHRPWGTRERLLEALLEHNIQAEPTPYAPDGVRLQAPLQMPLADLIAQMPRSFVIQDEAAQLLSHWLAPQDGEEILDACAAPGGKTTHLASLAPQAKILALDLHPHKLRLIEQNCQRLQISNVQTISHDATTPFEKSFDKILLDAPCSGLGTIRKHPEIRYRRSPQQIQELASLQAKLLHNLSTHLRPGGVLLYSVCTDTPEEGPQCIAAFLDTHPDFSPEPSPNTPWNSLILPDGSLHTSPETHNTDAFFAIRLRKTS